MVTFLHSGHVLNAHSINMNALKVAGQNVQCLITKICVEVPLQYTHTYINALSATANELQLPKKLQLYCTHGTFPSSTFLVPEVLCYVTQNTVNTCLTEQQNSKRISERKMSECVTRGTECSCKFFRSK
jgi:hypothetical protein